MDATAFFALGIVAGLLLILEGNILRRNGGRISTSVGLLTIVEIGWLILCIYALLEIELPGWTMLIPAAYLAYFLAAAWQYSQAGGVEDLKDFSDVRIPPSFATLEIYSGVGLLALSGLAWAQFAEQLARTS